MQDRADLRTLARDERVRVLARELERLVTDAVADRRNLAHTHG